MLASATTHRAARRGAIDAYLTKPVRRAGLLEAVATVLAPDQRQRATRRARAGAARADRRRVLVAEDNPVNQLVIQGMLAKRGLRWRTSWRPAARRSRSWTASATPRC